MKRLLALATLLSLAVVAGCSDDDNPTGPNNRPNNTATSTWVDSGFWRSKVDASSYTDFNGFSFTTKDTTTSGLSKGTATGWDLAFRREVIKLNGGSSTSNAGDCVGADLGVMAFKAVTMADTAGAMWMEDVIEYQVDPWYTYTGPPLHQLIPNRYVYSMVDAEGDNYIKFQIDSLVGAGMPPDMGTVYITYYYQPTADSRDLSGATTTAAIPVEMGTAYFDFSSGSVVTPATPSNSTEWDLAFSSYIVMQNSGPNGTGECAVFDAYTELDDRTDIDAFTTQPVAPLFPDNPSSALTDWYTYTGPPMHQLLSDEHVYLIRTGGNVYKLMIESYYANVGGTLTSGWYTFIWNEL
ncbi:MAG: HmuY family protein [Candidatus Zixiibacteriota bacterium]